MSEAGSGEGVWHRCSSCRKPIAYGATWWRCSVSTCNRPRTALRFCSVSCWDAHLSLVRHRESWAVEERAPASPEAARAEAPPPARGAGRSRDAGVQPGRPPRRIPGAAAAGVPSGADPAGADGGGTRAAGREPAGTTGHPPREPVPVEILVVASRLKHYVRARAGLKTSDKVLMPLSDHLRALVDEAIERARSEGRGTLLARDIPPPRR